MVLGEPPKRRNTTASRALPATYGRCAATALLSAASAALGVGCGGVDEGSTTAPAGSTLTLSLRRGPSGELVATLHAADAAGGPLIGTSPKVTVQGGTAAEVTESVGAGDYEVTITPTTLDREVVIKASIDVAEVTRTALVFSQVGDDWEQAEALDGYVNTGGWEDGASVSSDGEWLLLGSYAPTDLLTCNVIGGGAPDAAACNTLVGPTTAPERPDMLGVERLLSPTKIQNSCPKLGFPADGSEAPFSIPLVAAYGFRRQPDGSYREPFVIGFDANGCLGPYGISFVGPVSGTSTTVLFANDDPLTQGAGETSTDLYWSPLELGQKNILAKYSFDGTKLTATDVLPVALPLPDRAGTQGNVNFSGGRLWWDDESVPDEERDLFVADVSGEFPGATISATRVVGVSQADTEEIQPALDGGTLYWKAGTLLLSSALADGAEPAEAQSWAAPQVVIGVPPSADGSFVAVGEPTVAHVGAETWLYFVYIKKTDAGYDANVARIRRRE